MTRIFHPLRFVFVLIAFLSLAACQSEPPKSILKASSEFSKEIKLENTLFETLAKENLNAQLIQEIINEAKKELNLRALKPQTPIKLVFFKGPLEQFKRFEIAQSKLSTVHIEKTANQWVSKVKKKKLHKVDKTFQGKVVTTLWESAESSQMDPMLISKLAEVFAWQVDFAREIQSNDRWRISVEEHLIEGKHFGWGPIKVAELEQSQEKFQAVLYDFPKGDQNYFDFQGNSLRRIFLKSPIKFGRISSRFTRKRFHPVLKRNIPHRGVDYAAPRGTPIRSVGNGTILKIGRNRGAGKMIKIRHNSIYSTVYMHMHNFAQGMRKGKKVKQGQVIGYVGSTGLATGPHLHFEFHRHGRHINPLGHDFPSADPLPKNEVQKFQKFARLALKTLPNWKLKKETVAYKEK